MSGEDASAMGPRVKFGVAWKGTIADFFRQHPGGQKMYTDILPQLVKALNLLESTGAAPILPDGKVGGNCAVKLRTPDGVEFIVVSKSGKSAGVGIDPDNDFCIVSKFDTAAWSAEYYSSAEAVLPTCDNPLHHAVLNIDAVEWTEHPQASLHGHAIQSAETAAKLHLPCSESETLVSTPDDTLQLVALIKNNPYPLHRVYVRKGHGFFILGTNAVDAVEHFKQDVAPFM